MTSLDFAAYANLKQKAENSFPDCSTEGIKPIIEQVSQEEIEHQREIRIKAGTRNAIWSHGEKTVRRCCCCGDIPTKIAKFQLQGALVIERYCDSCIIRVEKL